MLMSVVAVCVGGSLGCLLRWVLSERLNALFPALPPGTLTANLVGGYLVGVAIAWLALHPSLPPQWRLFIITGFLGGLTTFSSFSAEITGQLLQGRLLAAGMAVAAHVVGSVAMTMLGIGTVAALRHWRAVGG